MGGKGREGGGREQTEERKRERQKRRGRERGRTGRVRELKSAT
jgi:hypothetical protein